MARYDKYDPVSGGHRAALAADFVTPANFGVPFGVGFDANGRVVLGAGNSGVKGIMILTEAKYAGDVVDVMVDGEIVEFAGGVAGTSYFVDAATGNVRVVQAPVVATDVSVGYTIEATRLVVHVKPAGGAA